MHPIFAFFLMSSLLFSSGCTVARVTTTSGPTVAQAMAVPSQGERLRVAVMSFENRSRYDVGQGMAAMLTSSLFATDRFIVLERATLSDVLLEQRLGTTGVVSAETAAPVGEIEGAEILVYGTVTEFSPQTAGVRTVAGGAAASRVAIELKLVDARTSRIVASTTVVGSSVDFDLDTSFLEYAGVTPLAALSAWSRTPAEAAIRRCIDAGVGFVVSNLE